MAAAPGSGQPSRAHSAASSFRVFGRSSHRYSRRASRCLEGGAGSGAGGARRKTRRRREGGNVAPWVARARELTEVNVRAASGAGNCRGASGGRGAGRCRAVAQETGRCVALDRCRRLGIEAVASEVYPRLGLRESSSGHLSHCGPQSPSPGSAAGRGHLWRVGGLM